MYACIIISPLGIRAHVACFLTCTHVSLCLISLRWWLRPRGRRWLVLQSDLTVPLPPSPVEQCPWCGPGQRTEVLPSGCLAVVSTTLTTDRSTMSWIWPWTPLGLLVSSFRQQTCRGDTARSWLHTLYSCKKISTTKCGVISSAPQYRI
jgi:hypothetical protein